MLDERNKKILCAVIQCYINSPGPVGSRVVTKKFSFGLSSATIRNTMSDLEEMGFLSQPHTSAGRVPTDSGYRFYVNTMTAEKPEWYRDFSSNVLKKFESLKKDINSFPDETSKMISELSSYIGLTVSQCTNMSSLIKIELLKYRKNQVAVVLLTDEGIIRNKIITFDSSIAQKDLSRIENYINTEFSGCTIDEIKKSLARELSRAKIVCDELISEAVRICRYIFTNSPGNVFISGITEMLELPDFCDIGKIKELLKTIEDKQMILHLLDKIQYSEGTQVFIGEENPLSEMKNFSFIVSTYKNSNRPVGAIGIIGPTRMNYLKAISIVDMTAKYITNELLTG